MQSKIVAAAAVVKKRFKNAHLGAAWARFRTPPIRSDTDSTQKIHANAHFSQD